MSKFYLVEDKETKEKYGLKILDKEKTEQVTARYKALKVKKPSEGEISMMFDHPYIVKTIEYGLTTTNEQYILMEYLEGTGLDNILTVKQDLLAGGRVEFIRQCAKGLQEVHDKGFIHRDYCPRNLMFTGDGTTLKLIDFGLTVPNCPPFTEPGNRTGNPNYIAPELIRRRTTCEKIDVFAFGVSMYEMCTRQLPWPWGDTGKAAMTHDQPPTPIEEYRPAINRVLARAIHDCIKPDPNDRPTLREFMTAIYKVDYEDE
ncbi:MAG: serine/threonine protein kinase [Thermoguttaceae bacterium]